jgi:hypothetical protein
VTTGQAATAPASPRVDVFKHRAQMNFGGMAKAQRLALRGMKARRTARHAPKRVYLLVTETWVLSPAVAAADIRPLWHIDSVLAQHGVAHNSVAHTAGTAWRGTQ